MTLDGIPLLAATGAAVIICFLVGLLVGFPALRLKGHFLAFVTLAFNTLVVPVLRNEDWLTGGPYGLFNMPRPDFWLIDTATKSKLFGLTVTSNQKMYYLCLVVFVVFAALMYGLVRSPWGRAFKALRENPIRAESLGLDTRRITLLAFAIGSAGAGLRRRADLAGRAVHRAELLCPHSFPTHPADGGGRGRGLLLRPDARSGRRHPAAGGPALHRRLLSHPLFGLRDRADGLFAERAMGLGDRLLGHLRPRRVARGDLKQGAQL